MDENSKFMVHKNEVENNEIARVELRFRFKWIKKKFQKFESIM